jgi:hypothetical protein
MRLTEWRAKAPARDAINDRVMAILESLIADFGADPDPECHVVWGDRPDLRYSILVPAAAGLVAIAVRTAEGTQEARATARLIRWPKLALGEFSVEATGEHRVVAVQVESFVLKDVDAEADLIAEFVCGLVLHADNLSATPVTADLVRALAESVGRIAIPAAVAPAAASPVARRAAPDRAPATGRKAAAKPAPRPAPRPGPRPREVPEGTALRRAAVHAAPKVAVRDVTPAEVPAAAAEMATDATPAEAPPAPQDMAPDVTPPAMPVAESMAMVAVLPEQGQEPASQPPAVEPEAAPVAPVTPRKPRVPRPVTPDAADKPKRPRRVHRDWPEPAGTPGWDGPRPAEDRRARKKPPRWAP